MEHPWSAVRRRVGALPFRTGADDRRTTLFGGVSCPIGFEGFTIDARVIEVDVGPPTGGTLVLGSDPVPISVGAGTVDRVAGGTVFEVVADDVEAHGVTQPSSPWVRRSSSGSTFWSHDSRFHSSTRSIAPSTRTSPTRPAYSRRREGMAIRPCLSISSSCEVEAHNRTRFRSLLPELARSSMLSICSSN